MHRGAHRAVQVLPLFHTLHLFPTTHASFHAGSLSNFATFRLSSAALFRLLARSARTTLTRALTASSLFESQPCPPSTDTSFDFESMPVWSRHPEHRPKAPPPLGRSLHKLQYRRRRVMNDEQRIAVCKTSISQISSMLHTRPHEWRSYLNLARSVIAHIDDTTFMQQPSRLAEQTWVVAGLQRLAYADADNGDVPDIAAWCARHWTVISQRDPRNIAALRGMGEAWLRRAQPALRRIHRVDGSSSSSGGSSSWSGLSFTTSEEERQSAASILEAERRAGTADYVEARGYLQPACEYLDRAVTVAPSQQALSGDLLAMTAEAYMSLGNASSPRTNEPYFHRALRLLHTASTIPGYTLSRYLQQYLDDYGRLLD